MRNATILALALGSFGLLPVACTQNFNYFSSSQGTGGATTSSSSSGTMSSSSGTSSSSSGAPACTMDSQCDDMNPCTTDACTTGTCTHTNVTDGTTPPGFMPTQGSCTTEQCMGGAVMTVPDDANAPMSGNPCVTDGCSMGMVTMTNVAHGQSCGGNNQICDGNGNCVGCTKTSDCQNPGTCKSVACTNSTCMVSNSAPESQCGGGKVCDGNGNCVGCVKDADCSGPPQICVTGQCMSSCNDGMKDGTETGKDCGGACPKCPDGQGCNSGADCESGNCHNGTCQPVANGGACTSSAQCMSGATCVSGVCCNSACTNTCQACLQSLTGQPNGTCANIMANTQAPSGQCTPATCGNTGKCDGNGACAQAGDGSNCGNGPSCQGGTETFQQTCSGGACGAAGTMMCSPYFCGGTTCSTRCNAAMQTGCVTGYYCLGAGVNGTCTMQLPMGSPCTENFECANGMCITADAGADAGENVCN